MESHTPKTANPFPEPPRSLGKAAWDKWKAAFPAPVCESLAPSPQPSIPDHSVSSMSTYRYIPPLKPLSTVEITIKDVQLPCTELKIQVLPDTGASVTAISDTQAKGMFMVPTKLKLCSADRTPFTVLGKVTADVTLRERTAAEHVYIVKNLERPLLSRRLLMEFGLIHQNFPDQELGVYSADMKDSPSFSSEKVSQLEEPSAISNHSSHSPALAPSGDPPKNAQIVSGHGPELDLLMNEFSELFDGKCTTMKASDYKIQLEDNAKPVSYGSFRNIQLPYRDALKRELDSLVKQGIIEPVAHATPWLHPIVIVRKKGTNDIRLCVDFTRLNRHVIRPVNPQPTPWEIVRDLPKGVCHYAVFDALKGYHQIPLAKESQDLTAFLTPFGRF